MSETNIHEPAMEDVNWTQMAISGFVGVVSCEDAVDFFTVELQFGTNIRIYKAPQGEDYYMPGRMPWKQPKRTFMHTEDRVAIEPPVCPLSIKVDGPNANTFITIMNSAIWTIDPPLRETGTNNIVKES